MHAGWTRTSDAACYNFLYCIEIEAGLEATRARTASLQSSWTEMRKSLDEVEAQKTRLLASAGASRPARRQG